MKFLAKLRRADDRGARTLGSFHSPTTLLPSQELHRFPGVWLFGGDVENPVEWLWG